MLCQRQDAQRERRDDDEDRKGGKNYTGEKKDDSTENI